MRKDGTQVSSPSTSYQIMTVSDSNGGIAIQAGASSDAFLVFGDYGQYDAGRIRYQIIYITWIFVLVVIIQE